MKPLAENLKYIARELLDVIILSTAAENANSAGRNVARSGLPTSNPWYPFRPPALGSPQSPCTSVARFPHFSSLAEAALHHSSSAELRCYA